MLCKVQFLDNSRVCERKTYFDKLWTYQIHQCTYCTPAAKLQFTYVNFISKSNALIWESRVIPPYPFTSTTSTLSFSIFYFSLFPSSLLHLFIYPVWDQGTPFPPFVLVHSLHLLLFLLFPFFLFSFALPIFFFVHPFPFYQNSHHSVFRPQVVGGDRTLV